MNLSYFESSICDCDLCRQQCRQKPGVLAPGDPERIAEAIGMEATDAFLIAAMRPETVPDPGNLLLTIPVLRPAQRGDGRCVFLGCNGCILGRAAPFGCTRINGCDHPVQGEMVEREVSLAIARDMEYIEQWMTVASGQLNALS